MENANETETKESGKLVCPYCGCELRRNKGWAAVFYEGYCNNCDIAIEKGEVEQ